jgi:RecJ-like exonuclease
MKTKILTHGDSDGVCAAALLKAAYPEAGIWITHPVGLLKDLVEEGAERVYICDVAISENEREQLFKAFERIPEMIYIDHHPLPIGVVSGDLPCSQVYWDTMASTSELAYRLVGKRLKGEMSRVALFGAISDYCDETAFIRRMLDAYDKRTIYMEAGLLSQALGEARGDYSFKKKIVEELSKGRMPSEMEGLPKIALKATRKEWRLYEYVKNRAQRRRGLAVVENLPRGYSPTKAAKFAIGVTGLPLGLSCTEKNGCVEISMRKKKGFHLDLNVVLRTLAPRYHGSGGGHGSAAGARIPDASFKDFLRALSREGAR